MLIGNHTVRIDEKGRIKLPATYRRELEDDYGTEFYVTSVRGDRAMLYPMSAWKDVLKKFEDKGFTDTVVKKFLDRTNFFGQLTELDNQGRLLIHPRLRQKAELTGDVAVIGCVKYLEVWDLKRFEDQLESDPFTREDEEYMSSLGV